MTVTVSVMVVPLASMGRAVGSERQGTARAGWLIQAQGFVIPADILAMNWHVCEFVCGRRHDGAVY